MNENRLETWTAELAAALGVDTPVDIDAVLDLAADAAHAVVRPAAPVTTFLAGLAAGRAGGGADEIREAIERAASVCAIAGEDV